MTIPDFNVAVTPLTPGTTLIEASAGTGKTYTIAGIFLRLIVEDALEVGEIVVTTFTEAATAELRSRIRSLLTVARAGWSAGASEHPLVADLIRRLPDQEMACHRIDAALRGFDDAVISTIHGFCQRTLRDRAFETHLLFDAELLQDQSAVLQEIAEDYWRRHFYEASPLVVGVALGAGLSTGELAKVARTALTHRSLRIIPDDDVATCAAALETLQQRFRASWPEWQPGLRGIFADASRWAKKPLSDAAQTVAWLDAIEACARGPELSPEALEAFAQFTDAEVAKSQRAGHTAPPHEFFGFCTEFMAARKRFAVAVRTDFLAHCRGELMTEKTRRNVVSFDDLLTLLHDALTGPRGDVLAGLLRARYKAALLDEFQDTDPTQEEIFRRIFGADDRRLFLIGDPKQAIYTFRGADIFSYLAAARRTARVFQLPQNQRSTARLVQAVNAIFARSPKPFVVDGIEFRAATSAGRAEQVPLRFGGEVRAPFRFWLPEGSDPLASGDFEKELPARVAAEIARTLAAGATLGAGPLLPQHIAVLVAKNDQARRVHEALARLRIPSVVLSEASLFDSPQAKEMRVLLGALLEPSRHGLIRAALAGCLFGFNAADVEALSLDDGAWEKWLLRFQQWGALWRAEGFIQCFREILRACSVRTRLLRRPDGERQLTNFLHLSEELHAAATAERLDPAGLRQWLAGRIAGDATEGEKAELRLDRDEAAVKVVTIHKSKGLEYPVVFCPFGWDHADKRKKDPPLFHDASADGQLTLDLGSDRLADHGQEALRERFAEQTRLLYVALTRASHECHFVWGRVQKHEIGAALWLLHPPGNCGADVLAVARAAADAVTPDSLRVDIAALAARHPDSFAIAPLPEPEAAPYRSATEHSAGTRARIFRGAIERDWRVSSFTSLTERRDLEQPDYDRAPAGGETEESEIEAAGIHRFPAGRTPGVFFHSIFEDLDFTDPVAVVPLVDERLRSFGFAVEEWRDAVVETVRRTLAVELERGLALRSVPKTARLEELEFYFPVERLTPASLSALLVEGVGARLSFDPRRGLLRGFIDLVFERGGKFYIVDWKSNRLGASAQSYDPAALAHAMARHHYGLQYHLYTLALDRYLRLRLGAGYDYERNFGGVFYVFVRGVDPALPELGIFRDRPPRGRIEQLASILPAPPPP